MSTFSLAQRHAFHKMGSSAEEEVVNVGEAVAGYTSPFLFDNLAWVTDAEQKNLILDSARIIANVSTYNRALDIISYTGFGMLMHSKVQKVTIRKMMVEKKIVSVC